MTLEPTQGVPGSQFFARREVVLAPVAAEDLVAWYPFREGTGADITAGSVQFGDSTDYSATVNGATFKPSGGVTDIKTGANSGAFDFDGTDDTLDLGTVADSDQSLTFMAWVKFDSASIGDLTRVITKFGGNNRNGAIGLDKTRDDEPRVFAFDSAGNVLATSPTTVTAGIYAHTAARYDFAAGEITIFVNGVPERTSQHNQMAALSSQPWRIGEDNPSEGTVFVDGTVDGVRIYTTALSDSQINQIYLNTEP